MAGWAGYEGWEQLDFVQFPRTAELGRSRSHIHVKKRIINFQEVPFQALPGNQLFLTRPPELRSRWELYRIEYNCLVLDF